jgi:hypothetical protein
VNAPGTPPAPSPSNVRCPACGPIGPADQEPVDFGTAYIALLKDWRAWLIGRGVMLGAGLLAGALHLDTAAVGAGGGAVITLVLIAQVQRVRRCRRCRALAR